MPQDTAAQDIIDEIIRREGGFVDHPHDRGGATNYGITEQTLAVWRDGPVTDDDVRNLTEEEAREIYAAQYISRPGYDRLPEPLRSFMVDSAVQHGPARATRWLQGAVDVKQDGVIGPMTLHAYSIRDPWHVYLGVLRRRLKFYGDIIAGNETQRVFAAGWFRRVAEAITV